MLKSLKWGVLGLGLFLGNGCFAWCATGHKLIAQIAYDQLTPCAKRYFAHLNHSVSNEKQPYTLVAAAVWMDTLFDPRYLGFKPMHYIDIPESGDGTPVPKMATMNAVVAIKKAQATLNDPNALEQEKAIALRIILHVVGDIHQPLHTITRVSRLHPQGDRGGNDFHLGKNKIGNNLHRYWDKGGGLLVAKYSPTEIRRLAKQFEMQWSCPTPDLDIMHWVQDSHAIAKEYAYGLEENSIPTADYQLRTQRLSEQQITYAGCRLALVLNHLKGTTVS